MNGLGYRSMDLGNGIIASRLRSFATMATLRPATNKFGVDVMVEFLTHIPSKKCCDTTLEFYRDKLDERRYVPARFLKMKGLTDEIGEFDPFLSSRRGRRMQGTSDNQDYDAVLWTRKKNL